ncbi:MAG: hypothetical protein OEL52_07645 [Nitrosopumilus sp.]|nr:hypothetical protein [Nitrosopumilus sp.]
MVKKRKPVLFIDDSNESNQAVQLLENEKIEYTPYHVKKFEESCCVEVPTTTTPSVFAPDGVFKGFEGVKEYVSYRNGDEYDDESPSAYW